MHYFQQRYLREASAFPALAGLLTIDLPNKGLLSGVEIRVAGICGDSVSDPDVWLHDRLKKIELIVNGSQVVKSLTGTQVKAMMHYKRTQPLSHDEKNMNNASCKEYFYLNLGRWYHDLEYMLDLGQVSDPELRIEYDFAMTTAAGWTNGTAMTAAPSYWIIPHMLRDTALVPKGFIKTAEIHRTDNAANLNYNLTVPRGPTYCNLYLDCWWASMGFGAIMDHIEVNINSDDLIPYRMRPEDITAQTVRQYGLFEANQQLTITGGQAYPFVMEEGIMDPLDADLTGYHWNRLDLWGNVAAPGFYDIATGLTPYVGQMNVNINTRGTWPHSVVALPIFQPWDPDTWIDTSTLGDFWVRIEELAGATAGVTKLLGDEVVTKYTTPSWP